MTLETQAAAAMLNTIVKESGPLSHWTEDDWVNLHAQFHRLWEKERASLYEKRMAAETLLDTVIFVIASLSWVIVWWLLEQWR